MATRGARAAAGDTGNRISRQRVAGRILDERRLFRQPANVERLTQKDRKRWRA